MSNTVAAILVLLLGLPGTRLAQLGEKYCGTYYRFVGLIALLYTVVNIIIFVTYWLILYFK